MTSSAVSPTNSQVNPSDSKTLCTCFRSTSMPSMRLSLALVSGTTGGSAPSSDRISTMPGATAPPATSWISPVARRSAIGASSGRRPFSNRSVASVRNPSDCAVSRLLGPENVADSRSTFTVSSLISLLAPPITPPRPMALLASAMTKCSVVSSRSSSSSVVRSSPGRARRTITVWSLIRS